MQIRVLGCQGSSAPARHLPGILLDGTVLLEAWSVRSTFLGDDNLKAVNDGDDVQVIGTAGLAFTY